MYLDRLEQMGDEAFHYVARDPGHDASLAARVDAVNRYLFGEQGFSGNRDQYEDPRNSCLNEVLDRRTGIPITMAVVYIEIARRAGVRAEGINFPGHFLVRTLQDLHTDNPSDGMIVDPFHAGAILNEADCRELLKKHIGEDAAFEPELLARTTRKQILIRMLRNLKGLYVRMHSFPQALIATDALLALQPCVAPGSPRPRAARLPHERVLQGAPGSRGVPQARAIGRAGRGHEEGERAGLGAREDAAPAGRSAELTIILCQLPID